MNAKELAQKCHECTVPWEQCNPPECLKDYLSFRENEKVKDKERGCLASCGEDPKCWVAGGMLDMSKCPLNKKKV